MSAIATKVPGILRHKAVLAWLVVAAVWIAASLLTRGFGAYGHLRYLL